MRRRCIPCAKLLGAGVRHLCPSIVVSPFLKWVGGKTQLLDEVFRLFPSEINNYYEPFLGGGSVLLALLSHRRAGSIMIRERIIASDCNAALIGLYKNIQGHCEELIHWLTDIGGDVSEQRYYELRDRFNELENKECLEASALMLILNKTGFRGMYREGPRGLNIPYGNYKNPGIFDEAHLGVVAELLQGVEFRCTDYSTALDMAKAGDFIYLDPPYAPEMATSFVGYNAGGFMDHATLFASIRRLPCNWLMSNSSVPAVHAAFDGCRVKVVEARRAINSKNPGAKTEEVLITNQSEMRAS